MKNMKIFLIISCLSLTLSAFNPFKATGNNHYAVLVAGSNDFWNYRHQSDIFHAYQILTKNGIPKENIIVFAYDDIARARENPFPGKVFNKPDPTGPGENVYEGVQIDYRGRDVTPKNFLAVLKGDKAALKGKGTGRVLESGENDNVFIYFSDHGGIGVIEFPTHELYAISLISTIKHMHENKRYKEMVIYIEACESGSMFYYILPKNINVYATTASRPLESSSGTYCGKDAVVNGKKIGSCLGDEYSVNWMEDTESDSSLSETLNDQYAKIKAKTKESHVQQYGDLSIAQKDIGQFQGNHGNSLFDKVRNTITRIIRKFTSNQAESAPERISIDSRDIKLRYLQEKAESTNSKADIDAYNTELNFVKKVDSIFNSFDQMFDINRETEITSINFECLEASVNEYKKTCNWGEYALKYVRNIAIACQKNISTEEIAIAFDKICILA